MRVETSKGQFYILCKADIDFSNAPWRGTKTVWISLRTEKSEARMIVFIYIYIYFKRQL